GNFCFNCSGSRPGCLTTVNPGSGFLPTSTSGIWSPLPGLRYSDPHRPGWMSSSRSAWTSTLILTSHAGWFSSPCFSARRLRLVIWALLLSRWYMVCSWWRSGRGWWLVGCVGAHGAFEQLRDHVLAQQEFEVGPPVLVWRTVRTPPAVKVVLGRGLEQRGPEVRDHLLAAVQLPADGAR